MADALGRTWEVVRRSTESLFQIVLMEEERIKEVDLKIA